MTTLSDAEIDKGIYAVVPDWNGVFMVRNFRDVARHFAGVASRPAREPTQELRAQIAAFLVDAPKGKPHQGYRYGELLQMVLDCYDAAPQERQAQIGCPPCYGATNECGDNGRICERQAQPVASDFDAIQQFINESHWMDPHTLRHAQTALDNLRAYANPGTGHE